MASSRYLRDEMDMRFIEKTMERDNVDESYNNIVDEYLKEEYDYMKGAREYSEDFSPIKSIMSIINKDLPDMRYHREKALRSIMWRLRAQSVVFEVFMDLYDAQLIDMAELQYVVDLHSRNETVWKVSRTFSAFEFGKMMDRPPGIASCTSYMVPELWLACMIVRGALAPLETIFKFIAERGTLGSFDVERFHKWWPEAKELEIDSMAMAVIPPHAQGFIGLHLPMGMSLPMKLEDIYYTIDEPLRRCEELFSRYFMILETEFVPAGRIWMP